MKAIENSTVRMGRSLEGTFPTLLLRSVSVKQLTQRFHNCRIKREKRASFPQKRNVQIHSDWSQPTTSRNAYA
jgi:hypothetical protein